MGEVSADQMVVAGTVVLIAIIGGLMKFSAWKGATDERANSLERSVNTDIRRVNKSLRTLRKEFRNEIRQLRRSILRRVTPRDANAEETAGREIPSRFEAIGIDATGRSLSSR